MKYRINESQETLIKELKRRKRIREQEYIAQAYAPTNNEAVQKQTPPTDGAGEELLLSKT